MERGQAYDDSDADTGEDMDEEEQLADVPMLVQHGTRGEGKHSFQIAITAETWRRYLLLRAWWNKAFQPEINAQLFFQHTSVRPARYCTLQVC